jgi:hypothetical protein
VVRTSISWWTAGLVLSLAARALAAPIDLTARLDPGQTGPIYSWSLMIRVDPGEDVGGVLLFTAGLTSFKPNAANPGIGIPDSDYSIDPIGDGRNLVFVVNYANGVDIVPSGGEALLGTFLGPSRSSPPVLLFDCEDVCGGTVLDPDLQPLPAASFALHVVPEPGLGALAAGLVALSALRARRPARSANAE